MRIPLSLLVIFVSMSAFGESAQTDRLTSHGTPRPRAENAVTDDWPHFLGSDYNLVSRESGLKTRWDEENEPKLLWEMQRGKGYAPPVAVAGKVVMAHRLDGMETIECLEATTGKRLWIDQVPVDFGESFGYPEAPQAPPTIDGERVYFIGTRALLRCYNLESGKIIWKRDLGKEFEVETHFFGKGGAPLIYGNHLILNLGGNKNHAVAAFDKHTGESSWTTEHEWDGSYASPVPVTIQSQPRILVFAGGKSKPTHGGLLSVDPENGKADFAFPWRATREASVNSSTPRVAGNRIFMSEAYTEGSVLLDVGKTMQPTVFKKLPKTTVQFMTPLVREGRYLYGITERTDITATWFCLDLETGSELWREGNYGRGNFLETADGIFATGEFGQFMSIRLTPQGPEILSKMQPFHSPESFCPPTIHDGLLFLVQSTPEPDGSSEPRLLCFDLRN